MIQRKEYKHTTKENHQNTKKESKRQRIREVQEQLEDNYHNDNKHKPINIYFKYKVTTQKKRGG